MPRFFREHGLEYTQLKKNLRKWLRKRDYKSILKFLTKLHPADISELIDNLPEDGEKAQLFSLLDLETASDVMADLSEDSRRAILKDITHDRLTDLVKDLPSDEAADILGVLPKERVERILAAIPPQDSAEVRSLLKYHEETAGGLMQTEVLALPADMAVENAIEQLRALAQETEEEYHNIFVINGEKKLLGTVSINKLILSSPEKKLSELMEKPKGVVFVDEDQEEVARKFQKYNLVSAPVVDHNGVLLGRITIDDIVDVVEAEVSEDLFRMAGVEAEETVYGEDAFRIARVRLPWLVVNILGELVTGYLLWMFKHTLADALILVSFIPVINATAGNAGLQSSSISVRGWATGKINFYNFKRQFLKESKVAFIMAFISGIVGGLAASIWHRQTALGLIVGVSMFVTINFAIFWGTILPAMLRRFGLDPAVAAGPFVATLNDIMGIVVYMSIATLFLHYLL